MTRAKLLDAVENALGRRKLVWLGTRGHDAVGLLDIRQFSEVFSIAAPLNALSIEVDVCLETLSGRRANLDVYTIDDDLGDEARSLRRQLHESLGEPAALAAYRPLRILPAVCFPRIDFVTYLGMFPERQAAFEHKPWVETEMRKLGVPTVPWRYFSDGDSSRVADEFLGVDGFVMRTNRSDGGFGLSPVGEEGRGRGAVPAHEDGFFAAAPLWLPHVPLNVNACVFGDGRVTVHGPSVQLIGVDGATSRRFGYCGNDFGAVKQLETRHLDSLHDITLTAGAWLGRQGYIGAFGVDAMVYQDVVYLVEINSRFQGSSMMSVLLDRALGLADVFMCHLAAFLGLDAPPTEGLATLAREQPACSQVVYHNCSASPALARSGANPAPAGAEVQILPAPGVRVEPEAILFRAVYARSVTRDGMALRAADTSELDRFVGQSFRFSHESNVGESPR